MSERYRDAADAPPKTTLKKAALAALSPVAWVKVFCLFVLAAIANEVAGPVGVVVVAGVAATIVALCVGVSKALRAGWKHSPVALAIIVLGIIFMGLFFVHYNGLTCAVKGGWVIDLGSGNSLCIGPS